MLDVHMILHAEPEHRRSSHGSRPPINHREAAPAPTAAHSAIYPDGIMHMTPRVSNPDDRTL